ncbi:MAG: hypothetical protein EOQ86_05160 [Mesorhizobium sp.]|uniref:ribbon-helix-helix protein n=1 Tax=Mesorhizobium sp. TaxID=1871066 RepID=UPI000FE47C95|nr:hypothetical protein [Mesorhizobium sp.]RWH71766.1 MAG: hypothetical protein EOQ85_29165 [Mesorhizobium sp.]RWH85576.1 MAG: hypothetical protein EOQ86_05160 [Mesorhizobium sp.]RWH90832.1 MAG: hypothetical protein EOQ87_08815 [Mesorhizobium sp.]RWH94692.1 MAG: hypothetical protein EOQ89_32890 [Mesorhizobium sp.]RWH99514.1 MAG: hypothetical protein EOQ88_08920 [Mesorhizobium sp.]
MTGRSAKHRFASRPGDPDRWIKSAVESQRDGGTSGFTARLTIDVTPELRGRIKVAAFQRGTTVADMLRDLLAREFPADDGDAR